MHEPVFELIIHACKFFPQVLQLFYRLWGPFLERPGKLTGPVSNFDIEVSRIVGCVLTSNEVHFVSLADDFTV